jgi:hypothetical protein
MNFSRAIGSLFLLGLVLTGCVSTGGKKPSAPPPPPTTPPVLPKTFGTITFETGGAVVIRYKTITLVMNAVTVNPQSPFDYLLLTGDAAIPTGLRKDQKILLTPEGETPARALGFNEVKALSNGQRLMLKKDGAFLFVSAVHTPGKNAYLLEFDAGRNVFISRGLNDSSSVRDFVYGLRDDGREIHVGLYLDAPDTDTAGKLITFMQPQIPVVNGGDAAALKQIFAQEMYNGEVRFVRQGDTIEF